VAAERLLHVPEGFASGDLRSGRSGSPFDRADKIYMLALKKGLRSPFEPADELHPDRKDEAAKPADAGKPGSVEYRRVE
jgi:hypothetical protein